MDKKKIILIGGDQMTVQEIVDRILYSDLDIEKIQVVGEGDRVGQIHEFRSSPILVISAEHMAEEGYDLAVMLSKMKNMEKVTSDMVFGSIPFIDMAGAFEPSSEVPLILPESLQFDLRKLPMIGVMPQGYLHAVASILSVVSEHCKPSGVTGFVINGVSQAGSRKAMDELFEQTRTVIGFGDVTSECFPHQIAFNCFHESVENLPDSVHHAILAHAMGNPQGIIGMDLAWSGHFVGIIGTLWIELEQPGSAEKFIHLFEENPGFIVDDDFGGALGVVGKDEILISNVKMVYNQSKRLTLRFGMDNLRRGLATSLINLLQSVWGD